MSFGLAIFLGCAISLAILGLVWAVSGAAWMTPRKVGRGDYVAEVWLEWDICRGSTLYRQRFAYEWQAALFAKLYAMQLDYVLPTHWRTTDYHGRLCWEKYEYGIKFGVRQVTPHERDNFQLIWSPVMPGHKDYAGEHATAHPWFKLDDKELNASVADLGFKL
jgi:hypothetical protein